MLLSVTIRLIRFISVLSFWKAEKRVQRFKGSKVFRIEGYMIYSNAFICDHPFNPFYQRSIFSTLVPDQNKPLPQAPFLCSFFESSSGHVRDMFGKWRQIPKSSRRRGEEETKQTRSRGLPHPRENVLFKKTGFSLFF